MRWLLPLIVVATIARPAGAQTSSTSPDDAMRAALKTYKNGDAAQGVAALRAIPIAKLDGAIHEFEKSELRRGQFAELEVAATALIDAALSVPFPDPQFTPLWHLGAGVGLTLIKAGDTSRAIRDWSLLADAVGEDVHDFMTLDQLLAELRAVFRGDAEILFVSGSMREALAQAQLGQYAPRGRDVTLVPNAPVRGNSAGFMPGIGMWMPNGDRPANLKAARDFYTQALAIAPTHAEARLRLARVLHQLGDLPGALAALDALPKDLPQELVYLSRLFRADIEAGLGHTDKSRAAYLAAMEWRAHAPFVGLAALLRADGDAAGALAVTQRVLDDAPEFDPWWSYLRGQGWHISQRLTAARAAVR